MSTDSSSSVAIRAAFEGRAFRAMYVPRADLWREDEFGEALLVEYHERVALDFGNNPVLRVLKVSGGVVHGSNPFVACLVDMIARPQARVATPVDLQVMLDCERAGHAPLKLRGSYKDAGLVLRSVHNPNGYLAQKLSEEVGLKVDLPAVVFLSGLRIVNDSDSPYGLAFELTDESQVVSAPVLMEKSGHFDNDVVDRTTGLPTRIDGAERYFYGSDEGLTRLYLGRGYALDTIWDELANSQPDGRVVLVDNRMPPAKMAAYMEKLREAAETLRT